MSVSMCDSLGEERPHLDPAVGGDVDHCKQLSDDIGALVLNPDYSDVTFIVKGKTFSAHRVILAARCHYFRALLFGGMRESVPEASVKVDDTTPEAFGLLLNYIYTGKLKLSELKEDCVLEILALSNKYGFDALEKSVSQFMLKTLNIANACEIYGVATLYSLRELQEAAAEFVDRNALDILNNDAFLNLSLEAVTSIIERDSFCASERAIFQAVQCWWDHNCCLQEDDKEKELVEEAKERLLGAVRLPLMPLQDLLQTVRPSRLISADRLLDAIQMQSEHSKAELDYRGVLCPDENVATMQHGAQVIQGEIPSALLDGDSSNYDMERGFSRHSIDDAAVGSKQEAGIVIKLGRPSIINHIRMLLWDKDMRAYSYYVEVSMDDNDWVKIINYSSYYCRSWQYLYFPKRVVRFIRVVGTHNTVNKVFHLVSLEAMFAKNMEVVEDGIIVPGKNVATVASHATVIEGVSRARNALLNGEVGSYDWDSGYTCHQLGNGAIVVQLNQPYMLSSLRLLLWDIDDRSYGFYIEISVNQKKWDKIVDFSTKECQSWQSLTFPCQPVVFVRIVGTSNTANEVFHCVHFECPDSTLPSSNSEESKMQELSAIVGDEEKETENGVSMMEECSDTSSRSSISSSHTHREPTRAHSNNQDENASGEGQRLIRHRRCVTGSFPLNPQKKN